MPADVYKEKLYEKKLFGEGLFFEAAHYAPSFEHRLLPLNYHPSLFSNVLSLETIKTNLPYSIQGSRSSLTGFPIRVSCDVVTLKDASGKISLEEALTTRMVKVSEWGRSRCQGVDVVEKNGQYLQFVFDVDPDAVVDLDQVHQAILASKPYWRGLNRIFKTNKASLPSHKAYQVCLQDAFKAPCKVFIKPQTKSLHRF